MKVLVDTNVILDVLLARRPHAEASAAVWSLIEAGEAAGYLSAHSITTIAYLIQKETANSQLIRTLARILQVFTVATVDHSTINEALALGLPDFEDSVTCAAARQAGCEAIVTRNIKDFRHSPIKCVSPGEAATLLRSE